MLRNLNVAKFLERMTDTLECLFRNALVILPIRTNPLNNPAKKPALIWQSSVTLHHADQMM